MSDVAAEQPAAPAPAPRVDLAAIDRELREVEQSLARLDDGSYGQCRVCGNALDDEALQSDPTLTVCSAHLDVIPPA